MANNLYRCKVVVQAGAIKRITRVPHLALLDVDGIDYGVGVASERLAASCVEVGDYCVMRPDGNVDFYERDQFESWFEKVESGADSEKQGREADEFHPPMKEATTMDAVLDVLEYLVSDQEAYANSVKYIDGDKVTRIKMMRNFLRAAKDMHRGSGAV